MTTTSGIVGRRFQRQREAGSVGLGVVTSVEEEELDRFPAKKKTDRQ